MDASMKISAAADRTASVHLARRVAPSCLVRPVPWLPSPAKSGAIFRDRDGKVRYALTLDLLDGQIQTIRSVSNPDKLGHLGPVADAWAVGREVNQAGRPRD
jgi:hypothetical protein